MVGAGHPAAAPAAAPAGGLLERRSRKNSALRRKHPQQALVIQHSNGEIQVELEDLELADFLSQKHLQIILVEEHLSAASLNPKHHQIILVLEDLQLGVLQGPELGVWLDLRLEVEDFPHPNLQIALEGVSITILLGVEVLFNQNLLEITLV